MTHSITSVSADNVPQLTYDGKPVVTTAVLAQLYGTDDVRIRQNYTKNKSRFEIGKHCFKVEGSELKDLKNRVSQSYSVGIGPNAKSIVLYTERGAARHAKMLETDQAWDVFEELEDNYFGPHQQAIEQQKALPNPLSPRHQRELQKAIAGRVCAEVPEPYRQSAFKRIYRHLKDRFDVAKYDQIDDSRYTEALGAVQSFEIEGDWIEAKPEPTGTPLSDRQLYDVYYVAHHFAALKMIFERYDMYCALRGLGSQAGIEMIDHFTDGYGAVCRLKNQLDAEFDAVQRRLRLNHYGRPALA